MMKKSNLLNGLSGLGFLLWDISGLLVSSLLIASTRMLLCVLSCTTSVASLTSVLRLLCSSIRSLSLVLRDITTRVWPRSAEWLVHHWHLIWHEERRNWEHSTSWEELLEARNSSLMESHSLFWSLVLLSHMFWLPEADVRLLVFDEKLFDSFESVAFALRLLRVLADFEINVSRSSNITRFQLVFLDSNAGDLSELTESFFELLYSHISLQILDKQIGLVLHVRELSLQLSISHILTLMQSDIERFIA